MKHSPEPWTFDREIGGCRTIRCNRPDEEPSGRDNEVCTTPGLADDAEDYSNACLIIAAPMLLSALIEAKLQITYLQEKFGATGTGNATLSRIEMALAKAEGMC